MNISDASLVLGLTVSPNEGVGLASAQRDMEDFFFQFRKTQTTVLFNY